MTRRPTGEDLRKRLNERIVDRTLRDAVKIWVPPAENPDDNPADPDDNKLS
jgi:hypothetical protein